MFLVVWRAQFGSANELS